MNEKFASRPTGRWKPRFQILGNFLAIALATLILSISTMGADVDDQKHPRNMFQDGMCAIADLLTEFMQRCTHGQNCGGGCAPYLNVR